MRHKDKRQLTLLTFNNHRLDDFKTAYCVLCQAPVTVHKDKLNPVYDFLCKDCGPSRLEDPIKKRLEKEKIITCPCNGPIEDCFTCPLIPDVSSLPRLTGGIATPAMGTVAKVDYIEEAPL